MEIRGVKLLEYFNYVIIFITTNLKDNISRTLGALGIFINKEFAKNVIRRRASIFWGTFIADSLTVKSK